MLIFFDGRDIINKKGSDKMLIGERIKARRLQIDMSQDELAKKVGYKSRSSINKIELDGRGLPYPKIVKIAEALQVTPGYLMGWEDDKEEIPAGDDRDSEIIRMFSELTDDEKKSVLDYIAFVLSKRSDA